MPSKSTSNRRVRRTKKTDAPAKEAPVKEAAAPKEEAPVEASPALVEADTLIADLVQIVETLKAENTRLREVNREVLSTVDGTVKRAVRFVRKATKGMRPKRKASPNSGFQKPGPLTDEFCRFLNKPPGTLVSRTEATKGLRDYIKANDLQNPEDRRQIFPDDTLMKLLKMTPKELKETPLTYFNLNGKAKHLFVKA